MKDLYQFNEKYYLVKRGEDEVQQLFDQINKDRYPDQCWAKDEIIFRSQYVCSFNDDAELKDPEDASY